MIPSRVPLTGVAQDADSVASRVRVPATPGLATPPDEPICARIESQSMVLGVWLDRLIEQGDPGDLISMVHRQQAWLDLMRQHARKR